MYNFDIYKTSSSFTIHVYEASRIIYYLMFDYTGEEDFSYGYGGTGKASVKCKFENFGEKFGVGDVIGAYVVSVMVYTKDVGAIGKYTK